MTWTPRDDRPDVDDPIAIDHVIRVVPVHRPRRIARHQLDDVADVQRVVRVRDKDAGLLVDAQDLQVVAANRAQRGRPQRLVTGGDDDTIGWSADDGGEYGQ